MQEAIQAMKAAYAALSNGQAELPLRTHLPVLRMRRLRSSCPSS